MARIKLENHSNDSLLTDLSNKKVPGLTNSSIGGTPDFIKKCLSVISKYSTIDLYYDDYTGHINVPMSELVFGDVKKDVFGILKEKPIQDNEGVYWNWCLEYAFNEDEDCMSIRLVKSVSGGIKVKLSKIIEVNEDMILFDDGSKITYSHDQQCCEYNYADFEQLDDIARNTDFDTKNMIFEVVQDSGFRFGNEGKMFFIPCYSEQNGCYSSDISIKYKGHEVLSFDCEYVYNGCYS